MGYKLKVGDVDEISESSIVDELLFNVPDEQERRIATRERQVRRKGFIIGGGIGIGGISLQANSVLGTGAVTRASFLTDFKIGYAPSNTLEIYYVSKVFWWGEGGVTIAQGLSALGFSAYLNGQTQTGLFLTAGAGVSSVDAPFEDANASYGIGAYGGLGYEFARHWSFELDLVYSYIRDFGLDLQFFGVGLTISGLGY